MELEYGPCKGAAVILADGNALIPMAEASMPIDVVSNPNIIGGGVIVAYPPTLGCEFIILRKGLALRASCDGPKFDAASIIAE